MADHRPGGHSDDAPASTSRDRNNEAVPDDARSVDARAVTINQPVSAVYARFTDFSRLSDIMENVERVDVLNDSRTHWVVKAPGGRTVEWDARTTEQVPDRLIAWESEEGADVPNSGRVEFRDAGERGTVVTATIAYDPPLGVVGKLVAKLFQREPAIQARRDLRRFKQLMETGEVATAARNRELHEKEDA